MIGRVSRRGRDNFTGPTVEWRSPRGRWGASYNRKPTSSGVERRVMVWRFGQWEHSYTWWLAG